LGVFTVEKRRTVSEFKQKKRKRIAILLLLLAFLLLGGGIIMFMSQSYTITFDSRGGEILPTMKGTRKSTELPVPVRPGQTFLGWSTTTTPGADTSFISSTKQLSGKSTTLHAHWEETNFVINFYSEGEQINQLGYNEDTAFTSQIMRTAPFSIYWMLAPQSESAHISASSTDRDNIGFYGGFKGWTFKDLHGNNAWLWFNNPAEAQAGVWSLQLSDSDGNKLQPRQLTSTNPFVPQLYDNSMHAVWDYKGATINVLTRDGLFPGREETFVMYGTTIPVGQNGSLSTAWYTGDDMLVGWKIGFRDGGESPITINTESGRIAVTNSNLTPAQLQRINDLLDKTYPVSEPFFVDPLLAYLSYQTGSAVVRQHTLYIYPVTVEEGESRFFDARFNVITESSTILQRVNDGTEILFRMPRSRDLETFIEYRYDIYDLSGPTPVRIPGDNNQPAGVVTVANINQGIGQGRGGAARSTSNMHPRHATIFYEVWEKRDVTVHFDYGPAAEHRKGLRGFYNNGIRKIHGITFGDDEKIKARYMDARQVPSLTNGAGSTIILPSASMWARPNLHFIGWQVEVREKGERPGRVYPAGYEYTIADHLGLNYTMHAIWSDSQVNFSLNLAGGRGMTPADIQVMRGREGETAVLPTDAPTRFGYDFVNWRSNRTILGKYSYNPGDSIPVTREKQILTAVWKPKPVITTLHYEYDDINDNKVSDSMQIMGMFDQTIRLRDIQEQSFRSLYRQVGWTFRSANNPHDPRAITFGPTQTVNLNERVVREASNGDLYANAYQEAEKSTVEITIIGDRGREPINTLHPVINSSPLLTRSAYTTHIRDVMQMDQTHDFRGFFALPKWVVEAPGFDDFRYHWSRDTGMYTTGAGTWVEQFKVEGSDSNPALGQILNFFPTPNGDIARVAGSGSGNFQPNFKVSEDMYFYLLLQPKPVTIEYYGFTESGGVVTGHTLNPIQPTVSSYFGDVRPETADLGSGTLGGISTPGIGNLGRVPRSAEFFFLDWTVEYYTATGTIAFLTHPVDIRLNADGRPEASFESRLLRTAEINTNSDPRTGALGAPVARIAVKPNMQNSNEFVVRIVDDGTLTGTRGRTFSVVLEKQGDKPDLEDGAMVYVGGEIRLGRTEIMGARTTWHDPIWGAARWSRAAFGDVRKFCAIANDDVLYYWNAQGQYIGPGSSNKPYVTLEDMLDDKSKGILRFGTNQNALGQGVTPLFNFYNPTAFTAAEGNTVSNAIKLHTDVAVNNGFSPTANEGFGEYSAFFDVRQGSVSLYPVFSNIEYRIEIISGKRVGGIDDGKDIVEGGTITHADGRLINANDQEVRLGVLETYPEIVLLTNADVTPQPGFYFDERVANLSMIDYLAPENHHIPRDQRVGTFKIGESYKIGNGAGQIPTPVGFSPGDPSGVKVIRLYIVWLPTNITLRYENTGEGSPSSTAQSSNTNGTFMTGISYASLAGNQSGWFNPGFRLAGWSVNPNGTFPRFPLNQSGVLLSHHHTTGPSVQVLNHVTGETSPMPVLNIVHYGQTTNTTSYPHVRTVTLYPYWEATAADSITFDFSPLAADIGAGVLKVEPVLATNRFTRPSTSWDPVPGNDYAFSISGTDAFAFGTNIGDVEADWRNFIYELDGEEHRMFAGWYYTDVYGNSHDLTVVNGQLMLTDIFLGLPSGNQRSIVKNIVIRARWVQGAQELVQFNIAEEAKKIEYLITATCGNVNVMVTNGVSGDAEISDAVPDNTSPKFEMAYQYTLARNKYIGPALMEGKTFPHNGPVGSRARAYNVSVPTTDPAYYNKYDMAFFPQFYRTEVAVRVYDENGVPRNIVKALNPLYERLEGEIEWAPSVGLLMRTAAGVDNRQEISLTTYTNPPDNTILEENPLVRWETRRIPTWTASPMSTVHPYAVAMRGLFEGYNTTNMVTQYATFDRNGVLRADAATFRLEDIEKMFITDMNMNTTALNRLGYDLVGFAISDEFNKGMPFIVDGAPNNYYNNYMFSPRPERVSIVPIYQPLPTKLTFVPADMNAETARYVDIVFGDMRRPFEQDEATTGFEVPTFFDEIIDLPMLDTRGAERNPLLDVPGWLQSWSFGSGTTETHAVFGETPLGLAGHNTVSAIGYHVQHNPRTITNLVFESTWGSSTRMEINFHVLVPQSGVPMNQWSTERLYFNQAKIDEIANDRYVEGSFRNRDAFDEYKAAFSGTDRFLGDAVVGSVAEHYRKPTFENGVYDRTKATYTIPTDSSGRLDSAFTLPASITQPGLRPLGWFMEHQGTGRPHISLDQETRHQNVTRTLDGVTGNFEYSFRYHGGEVDRFWQQDRDTHLWGSNPVNIAPHSGGGVQSVNVYLVYDFVEGTVVFHGGFPDVVESYPNGRAVSAKFGWTVALPTSAHISRPGRDFYGWTNDAQMGRMRSYVDTLEEARKLPREYWAVNDFVKVENDGRGQGHSIYRKVMKTGFENVDPSDEVRENSELVLVTVYNNSYLYNQQTVHGGRVDMYAIWEERIVVHSFRDGVTPESALLIWGGNDTTETDHSSLYGRETDTRFQNGITSEVKYFFDNVYGEIGGVNSALPVPTKEGFKFLYWVNSHGLMDIGSNWLPSVGDVRHAYVERETKVEFASSTTANLYAIWTPYYYELEFDENNVVPGHTTSTWESSTADMLVPDANKGRVINGLPVARFAHAAGINGLIIPEYEKPEVEDDDGELKIVPGTGHFIWSDLEQAEAMEFLGWTLARDDASFLINTREGAGDKEILFGRSNIKGGNNPGARSTVKVGILNRSASDDLLDYKVPAFELRDNQYVRTVKLYAFWNFGKVDIAYRDNGAIVHTQDGFLLDKDREEIRPEYRLVVPSLDDDYIEFGVMVADESVIGEESPGVCRVAAQFARGKSFGGWRVTRGPVSQMDKIYYPGDFLDGHIASSVHMEAIWYDWHDGEGTPTPRSNWTSVIGTTGGAVTATGNYNTPGVLVLPSDWNNAKLNVTNSNANIHTIIFPMNAGHIPAGRIEAHNVTRIMLPSMGAVNVAPQAIHAARLEKLYLGDNLGITGNPVAGRASVNASGLIEIESAMTAYLVRQGAQKFVPGSGMQFAIHGEEYSDEVGDEFEEYWEDPDYLRGGSKNTRSTKFAYVLNRNFFGQLYSTDFATLFAYPNAATEVSISTSVRQVESYAFAYMSKLVSTNELTTVSSSEAITVKGNAIFHTNARVIRLPQTPGSIIALNAISGFQPQLRNVYFGISGTTDSSGLAHVHNNILYLGSTGTRTDVMYVLRHDVAVGNGFVIPSSVQRISDYALSSFYIGTGTRNVTNLTIEASGVELDMKHFNGDNGGRSQHTFYLNGMTISGLESIDHRIIRGENNLTGLNVNSIGISLDTTRDAGNTDEFPIFALTKTILDNYMTPQMAWATTWGALTVSGNFRMQTMAKPISYASGSVNAGGNAPSSPVSVNYEGTFEVPHNTFTAPEGTVFVGWRVTSGDRTGNNAINNKIYQPGTTFDVGMTDSGLSLNTLVGGTGIYIQSGITLTAVWEIKRIQFVDKDGNRLENQTVLVREAGELRQATNMELAGKIVRDNGLFDDDNAHDFFLTGANLAPFNTHQGVPLGDTYAFVGWLRRDTATAQPSQQWQWNHINNVASRIIPDGNMQDAVDIQIASSIPVAYYHALYDISSGTNVTYTATGTTNLSARATNRTGSGNIGIPAAVIDTATNVNGVLNAQGFMRRVTVIESNGFHNMTDTTRTKVYIGGMVQTINHNAFMGSKHVNTVEFGHINIENGAPGRIVGARTLAIGNYAFGEMGTTQIVLPLVTTTIGAHAFVDNLSLQSVQFNESAGTVRSSGVVEGSSSAADSKLTSIGAHAFWGARELSTKFFIPSGVTNIGPRAFELTQIPRFESGRDADEDGYYFEKFGNLYYQQGAGNLHFIMFAPGNTNTNAITSDGIVSKEVLEDVHRIVAGAFAWNDSIKHIELIPDTVSTIDAGAFEFSHEIDTITIAHLIPSDLHNGGTPAHNPFARTAATIIVSDANSMQLAQWRAVAVYRSIFVNTVS
jgi:hypothetical protein